MSVPRSPRQPTPRPPEPRGPVPRFPMRRTPSAPRPKSPWIEYTKYGEFGYLETVSGWAETGRPRSLFALFIFRIHPADDVGGRKFRPARVHNMNTTPARGHRDAAVTWRGRRPHRRSLHARPGTTAPAHRAIPTPDRTARRRTWPR